MRKQLLFLFMWLGSTLSALAQTPVFLAYNEQNQPVQTICVGEHITFRDNTSRSTDPNFTEFYDFNADDGIIKFEAPQHIFTTPGRFTVTQLANGFDQSSRTFDVKAPAPPTPPILEKITLVHNGLQIQIQSTAVNEMVVEQEVTSGNFTQVGRLSAVPIGQSEQSLTFSSSANGCYRLKVINLCTGEENIVSTTVCAQTLQVTAGDRQNQLNWQANASNSRVVNYQLLRDGRPYQNLLPSQASYTDDNVACGRSYIYQLVALLQNGSQSASLVQHIETQGTTPPAPPQLIVTFTTQNQVVAETIVPVDETFKEQALYRSLNTPVFDLISEKQPQNAVDALLVNFPVQPCYQTTYTDLCNLSSPRSNTACPALLTAALQQNGSVQLHWNAYQGFATGIGSQSLELLDEQGNVYWTTNVSGQSFLDMQPQEQFQRLKYRLLTTSQDARSQSYSNIVTVDQAFQFYFPTAFSPNNDGLNDVFRAIGKFASNFHLQVFNRWGQIIFESTDLKVGWDGTYAGKPAPPETYLYRFEATDSNGQKITKSGTITLVR